MSGFRSLPDGIRRLFRLPQNRARLLREMDDEIRVHLAMRIDELRSLGMSVADAEAEALRRFGDSDEYHAYAAQRAERRERWRSITEWIDEWTQDLQFAGRQFRRNAGFTALAVFTLALGIGANSAIFSVVHRLLIAPLPYADGDRIVKLVLTDGNNVVSPRMSTVRAWRDRSRSLEMVAAVSVDGLYLQDFGDTPDTIPAFATTNYFALLGLRPALGRAFTPEDERPGAPPVAMVSYGKWQREYGGGSGVLGATVRIPDLDDRTYTVVGVAPKDISIPMSPSQGVNLDLRQPSPAIWLPSSLDSIASDHVFGKLRRGITAAAASVEMQAIMDDEPRPAPGGFRMQTQMHARAMRAQDFLDPLETRTVQVLFVAVAVLLLIACANVANLLMSRAWTRSREFAVRTALGAGRARLARQVLTESIALALAGGLAGVFVAWGTLKLILALRPASLEELTGVQIELPILLWSAAISIVTGILFGCAPALFAGSRAVGDILRRAAHTASSGTALRRMRSALIVLEIALSLVLLIGAGLLVRSFAALQAVPLNFEPRGLVSANVFLMFPRTWTPDIRAAQRNDLLDRLRAIPGVSEASIGMMPGLGWRTFGLEAELADGQAKSVGEYSTTFVTADYFRIVGMRLVAGRVPDSLTGTTGLREAVVNQTLAKRLWGNREPLGARLYEKGGPPGMTQSYIVVGVVDDIQLPGRRSAAGPADIYGPLPPRLGWLPLVIRTTLPESTIIPAIRRTVAEYDPALRRASGLSHGAVVQSVTIGETYVRESLAPTRFAMALLLAFAVIALVLSTVGLYGVIGYSVAQRTREIGVRVALGADERSVKRLVVGAGLRLTALGVVVGLGASFLSTRLLASLLYGVSPADPTSFVAIMVLVVMTALLASYVPARRAVQIDPVAALRAE